MLQSTWDTKSFYIHAGKEKVGSDSDRLEWRRLISHLIHADTDDVFIFHAQSSLPYIMLAMLLKLIGKVKASYIYDIHDLNEYPGEGAPNYLKLRYLVLYVIEGIVLSSSFVRAMTVSNGIANILMGRAHKNSISVVRSIPMSKGGTCCRHPSSDKVKLVFFGTGERAPLNCLDEIRRSGFSVDLYGEGFCEGLKLVLQNNGDVAKYKGPYSPNDINFLFSYDYLLMVSDIKSNNFRYSLPNKLFQSFAYGIIPILSPTFEEAISLFSDIKGAILVWDQRSSLSLILEKHTKEINKKELWAKIYVKLNELHNESAITYKQLIQNNDI